LRRRLLTSALLLTGAAVGAFVVPAQAHPGVAAKPLVSPAAALSTNGDYATDVLSDPWDFSNDEDVPPIAVVGSENGYGISRSNGTLTVLSGKNTTIKLVRTWGVELPWGRDGLLKPVDADRYTVLTFSMCLDFRMNMGIHFWNEAGGEGLMPIYPLAGCNQYSYNLKDGSQYPFPGLQTPWTGKIIRLELLNGGAFGAGPNSDPKGNVRLDWVRLHRPDASAGPPAGLPIPQVLSPNVEGGADYASATGNPWDFNDPSDTVALNDMANVTFQNGVMSGVTVRNDSYVELPMRMPMNPDRYHRATFDVCYGGAMSFADAAGGGMNARFAWVPAPGLWWAETQDIIIYPGCNRMTVDLSTNPAAAVNDENTTFKAGWRGQEIQRMRFDLNEDRGTRSFTINEIKLADDAAFADTFPITFQNVGSNSGTTVDIYVSTTESSFTGTRIASNIAVNNGVNTFVWNGRDQAGNQMPNATYWVWMTMRNGAGVGSAMATGPVRIERPVSATPSYFVPLSPSRIFDTRDGTGGNVTPLGAGVFSEVNVAGVGGVPPSGATAVVMNVTVDNPSSAGFLSVWPSGEERPLVSSLNFEPRQTVPNLVAVKIGANGKVNIFNSSGATSVLADVVGYYTATPTSSGRFTAVTPGRVLDTREGIGTGGSRAPVGPGQSISVPVTGLAGVPSTGVSAVAVNVTVDVPTSGGFLTVWPSLEARPNASSHNFTRGLTRANLVLAKVGTNGRISIYNSSGSSHVVADVVGYFSASGGLFVPVTPRRMVDTRDGTGVPVGPIQAGSSLTMPIGGVHSVPTNAQAAIVNVTAVRATAPSYVTVWPTGSTRPTASTLNPIVGLPVPNLAYMKLGSNGRIDAFNFSGSTDLIVDVFGYII
jgi:hypothetical protein